ncbi:MAG TPA: NAD(P)H-binding protein [Candidatus Dormibacteraeota bacterium]|nr:NAD(P)H-binding protein [Candidatus Dormibacteraeota bacterium]
MTNEPPLILLTGATGYVGGRLLSALEAKGCLLARRPEFLRSRVGPSTEVVPGDLLDRNSLDGAMAGAAMAYYLVHSMASGGSFAEEDRRAAANFAAAARQARVRRIV